MHSFGLSFIHAFICSFLNSCIHLFFPLRLHGTDAVLAIASSVTFMKKICCVFMDCNDNNNNNVDMFFVMTMGKHRSNVASTTWYISANLFNEF